MTRRHRVIRLALVLVTGAALTGCGAHSVHSSSPSDAASRLPAPSGVAEVRLVAPPEHGAGATPTFRWSAVNGAAQYQLFVRDAQGRSIWAWQGNDTSARMGGLSIDLPAGASGPRLVPGSSWLVMALGQDGKVRAVSAVRPASP